MWKIQKAAEMRPGQGFPEKSKGKVAIRAKSKVPGVMITQLVEKVPEGKSTPDFTCKPIALTIQEGKSAVFKAIVTGDPKPSVTWARSKGDMKDPLKYQHLYNETDDEYAIQIPNVTPEQADTYKCFATNEYGRAVCTATLNVIKVAFEIPATEATKENPAEFRKMLKPRVVLPAPGRKKEGEIDPKFWEILLSSDKKDYERICAEFGVTNFRWMLKELNQLKEQREKEQAQFIENLSKLKHIEVNPNGSAEFGFSMDLKNKCSQIFLYKDGGLLPLDESMECRHHLNKIGRNYVFSIKDLTLNDAGLYQVCVEDATIFSTDFKIIPVEFIVKIQEVKAMEREDAAFECLLSHPVPKIVWMGKNKCLEQSDKYDITVSEDQLIHRLVVKDCILVDKGIYAAVAGIKSCSAWLLVEADPDANTLGKKKPRKTTCVGGGGADLLEKAREQHARLKTESVGGARAEEGMVYTEEGRANMVKITNGAESLRNGSEIGCQDVSAQRNGLASVNKLAWMGGSEQADGSKLDDAGDTILGWSNSDSISRDDTVPKKNQPRAGPLGTDMVTSHGGHFVRGLQNASAIKGQPVELLCELSTADSTGAWYKDGKLLSSNDGYAVKRDGACHKLLISNCHEDHAGKYRFEADGQKTEATLTVQGHGYRFVRGLQDTSAITGKPVELLCELSTADCTGYWYKDGKRLSSNDGYAVKRDGACHKLLISNCHEDHAGKYRFEADGQKTEATLTVQGHGYRFVRGLQDTSAITGKPVELLCELSTADCTGFWYKDGKRLSSNDGYAVKRDGACHKLLISNCHEDHAGKYRFEADGQKTEATLTVQGHGYRFVRGLQDTSAITGKPVELLCELSTADCTGFWYKDGKRLSSNDGYGVQKDGAWHKLLISNCHEDHAGKYRFEADGQKTEATLTVQAHGYRFVRGLQDTSAVKGKPVELLCELSTADCTGFWYKDGERLFAKDGYAVKKDGACHKLLISNCREDHAGKYRFEADGQKTEATVIVQAHGGHFVRGLQDTNAIKGQPVELLCELSTAASSGAWYKDEKQLSSNEGYAVKKDGTCHKLLISNCREDHAGKYRFEADGRKTEATLTVQAHGGCFVRGLHDTTSIKGQPVELLCELSTAASTGAWYKDGKQLSSNEGYAVKQDGTCHKLLISNCREDHAGKYAFDADGRKTEATLTVQAHGTYFVRGLQDTIAIKGRPVELLCEHSTADCTGAWYKDGELLSSNDECAIKKDGACHKLLIRSCREDRAGKYRFEADGQKTEATLTVQAHGGHFVRGLQDTSAIKGQPVELLCEHRSANCTGAWFKDGKLLSSNDEYAVKKDGACQKLLITKCREDHAGKYRFEADGQKTEATLTVQAHGTYFVRGLQDTSTIKGQHVELLCEHSTADCTGTWYKDGKLLSSNEGYAVKKDGACHKLVISNCCEDHAGKYRFEADGQKTEATLTLQAHESHFVRGLHNTSAIRGQTVEMLCELKTADCKGAWYKDGKRLSAKDGYVVKKDGASRKLLISNCREDHTGKYRFEADGQKTEAKLTVQAPVVNFIRGLQDTSAIKGQPVELLCELSTADCTGAWYKDGKQLSSKEGYAVEKDGACHKLLISNCCEDDAGKYRFEAERRKTEATLIVQDPPRVDDDTLAEFSKPVVVRGGEKAIFKLAFVGHDPMKVQWYLDDEEKLDSGNVKLEMTYHHSRLLLGKCQRRDSGEVKVKIKNDFGTMEAKSRLIVLDKPTPPQGPLDVIESSANCIEFKWRPPKDDGGSPLINYNLERKQVGRNTWKKIGSIPGEPPIYRDTDVEHGKKYCYRIRAITAEGESEMIETEDIQAGTKAYPGPPAAPKVVSAFSDCISISWSAPTKTGGTAIVGYNLEKRKKGSNIWSLVNAADEPIKERKCAVTDVVEGLEYEFRVLAINFSGAGEPSVPSETAIARDPKKPPGEVIHLKVTDSTHTTLCLSWTQPHEEEGVQDEAQGYFVEIRPADDMEWIRCNTSAIIMTCYTVKGLRPMAMYWVRVIATNDGGEGEPQELDNYIIAMPPRIRPRFTDSKMQNFMVVRAGNSVRVNINFEASPMPDIIWLKDGTPVSKRITVSSMETGSQLLIPTSEHSDTGIYTIIIKNIAGQETFDVEIIVTDEPKPPGPVELEKNVSGTVTLSWAPSPDERRDDRLHYMVSKLDPVKRAWETVADNLFNNKFTVCNIIPGHDYYFRVYAKNDIGQSLPSKSPAWGEKKTREKLSIITPSSEVRSSETLPSFLVPLKIRDVPQGYECHMSCAVRGDPAPHVTWYRDGVSLNTNDNYYITNTCGVCSMLILSVGPNDSGEYKVIAENPLGRAECSTRLTIRE